MKEEKIDQILEKDETDDIAILMEATYFVNNIKVEQKYVESVLHSTRVADHYSCIGKTVICSSVDARTGRTIYEKRDLADLVNLMKQRNCWIESISVVLKEYAPTLKEGRLYERCDF